MHRLVFIDASGIRDRLYVTKNSLIRLYELMFPAGMAYRFTIQAVFLLLVCMFSPVVIQAHTPGIFPDHDELKQLEIGPFLAELDALKAVHKTDFELEHDSLIDLVDSKSQAARAFAHDSRNIPGIEAFVVDSHARASFDELYIYEQIVEANHLSHKSEENISARLPFATLTVSCVRLAGTVSTKRSSLYVDQMYAVLKESVDDTGVFLIQKSHLQFISKLYYSIRQGYIRRYAFINISTSANDNSTYYSTSSFRTVLTAILKKPNNRHSAPGAIHSESSAGIAMSGDN